MVIVSLGERLGNQMFQYAMGRRLAIERNTSLYFDLSYYGYRYNKSFYINSFNISGKVIPPLPIVAFIQIFNKHPILFIPITKYRYFSHRYSENFLMLPQNCFVQGLFQSEKYFKPIANVIKSDFTLRTLPLDDATKRMEEKIRISNSVSVHVRRQDYLDNNRYDVCDLRYYEDSINAIYERLHSPHFFIFSDDILWCRKNLKIPQSYYVDLDKSRIKPVNDMWLMSLCKHNVIANSTFSWWGAWLNTNDNKIVIVPSKWFNTKDINEVPINDKVPHNWLRIKA